MPVIKEVEFYSTVDNNLKTKKPSSATKVQHGLRPEEYFETSQPDGVYKSSSGATKV